MKRLWRYWGYLLFAVLVTAWWSRDVGPPALIALSVATGFYFFFRAPVWCGAITREGQLCRKNASGVLMGCGYRQHKWQKLKMTIVPHAWRELNRGLWATPRDGITTLGGVATIVSGFAAVLALLVG